MQNQCTTLHFFITRFTCIILVLLPFLPLLIDDSTTRIVISIIIQMIALIIFTYYTKLQNLNLAKICFCLLFLIMINLNLLLPNLDNDIMSFIQVLLIIGLIVLYGTKKNSFRK